MRKSELRREQRRPVFRLARPAQSPPAPRSTRQCLHRSDRFAAVSAARLSRSSSHSNWAGYRQCRPGRPLKTTGASRHRSGQPCSGSLIKRIPTYECTALSLDRPTQVFSSRTNSSLHRNDIGTGATWTRTRSPCDWHIPMMPRICSLISMPCRRPRADFRPVGKAISHGL